ncbi:MAG: hypothetical protein CMJ19_13310 [Phycisphaeraceae bacterium]|nr:hypothetical protein [Phycisphaeraceae bacterium]
MVNRQRLIKIAAALAIGVIVYTLRPMPEYALHARTAAGLYDQATVDVMPTLQSLTRQAASVEAEMINAQAMLDLSTIPQEAVVQLNYHLTELDTLAKGMHKQLVELYGQERIERMINLPDWATETIALSQVLKQLPLAKTDAALSKSMHRQLVGNLQWIERALSDLQTMLQRETLSASPTTPPSTPVN